MRDTLLFLVQSLVDHPNDVSVEEKTDADRLILTLHVNTEDMGKIIGKSGRIIRAIRDLVKVLAAKKNQFVEVEIYEEVPQP